MFNSFLNPPIDKSVGSEWVDRCMLINECHKSTKRIVRLLKMKIHEWEFGEAKENVGWRSDSVHTLIGY